jgi:hypothetical protein
MRIIKILYQSDKFLPKELNELLETGKKNLLQHSSEPDKTTVLFDAMRTQITGWFSENGKIQK